ncbi:MAG TPA: RlmE family RNA methyltransferase [Spirochaetota bacterium]|nr:RlmE family RNA methyltransferase [Spirochaetota bacterium]HOM37664.1 RlmE family RNA methyltransferase [Spirochaetota bacterium]HPQ49622.1 RlmE family RNA methyltransferase [Spirochaetota bacterium]
MPYNSSDFYFQKAKKDGYVARSVYKLEEIDKKYNIIKQGMKVLDLGASPGSWSQYCIKKVGRKGFVLGIDIKDVKIKADNFVFIKKGIEEAYEDIKNYGPFDIVLSDMAPNTSGIIDVDVYKSIELSGLAVDTALKCMKKNGVFIVKVFQGEDFDIFYREKIKNCFEKYKSFKPKAVRQNSKEIYIICWGLKGE